AGAWRSPPEVRATPRSDRAAGSPSAIPPGARRTRSRASGARGSAPMRAPRWSLATRSSCGSQHREVAGTILGGRSVILVGTFEQCLHQAAPCQGPIAVIGGQFETYGALPRRAEYRDRLNGGHSPRHFSRPFANYSRAQIGPSNTSTHLALAGALLSLPIPRS